MATNSIPTFSPEPFLAPAMEERARSTAPTSPPSRMWRKDSGVTASTDRQIRFRPAFTRDSAFARFRRSPLVWNPTQEPSGMRLRALSMKVSRLGWRRGSPIPERTRDSRLGKAGARASKVAGLRSPSTTPLCCVCLTHIWQRRLQRVVVSTKSFEGYARKAAEAAVMNLDSRASSLLLLRRFRRRRCGKAVLELKHSLTPRLGH
jgi:hypothetical protein